MPRNSPISRYRVYRMCNSVLFYTYIQRFYHTATSTIFTNTRHSYIIATIDSHNSLSLTHSLSPTALEWSRARVQAQNERGAAAILQQPVDAACWSDVVFVISDASAGQNPPCTRRRRTADTHTREGHWRIMIELTTCRHGMNRLQTDNTSINTQGSILFMSRIAAEVSARKYCSMTSHVVLTALTKRPRLLWYCMSVVNWRDCSVMTAFIGQQRT